VLLNSLLAVPHEQPLHSGCQLRLYLQQWLLYLHQHLFAHWPERLSAAVPNRFLRSLHEPQLHRLHLSVPELPQPKLLPQLHHRLLPGSGQYLPAGLSLPVLRGDPDSDLPEVCWEMQLVPRPAEMRQLQVGVLLLSEL
jgi:hypothetical protein